MRTPRMFLALAFFLSTIVLSWPHIAHAQEKAAAVLQRLDKNGDGKISLEEWPNPPKAFKMIDTDGDGYLSIEELKSRFGNDGGANGPGNGPQSPTSLSGSLYFVDAHSQMDGYVDEERILSLMARGGVHRTILSAQKGRTWQSIAEFAQRSPGQITAAAVIKGGGYHGGGEARSEFFDRLKAQAMNPAINAMAEVLVYHDGAGRYYNIQVDLTDELVQAALKVSKEKGWPFIIHIEFASLGERKRSVYMEQLSSLLEANPQHPFVLIHMGLLEEPAVRKLLARHPNLHFTLSATSSMFKKTVDGSEAKPFVDIFDGPSFIPQWRQLFLDYPNQFLFALDCANNMHWMEKPYLNQMRHWWAAMSGMPPPVASAIAHGNAERLWRIPPRTEGGMLPPDAALKQLGPVTGQSANRPI